MEGVPVRAGVFSAEGVMVPERVPVVDGVTLEVWVIDPVLAAEGVTLGVCVNVLDPVWLEVVVRVPVWVGVWLGVMPVELV